LGIGAGIEQDQEIAAMPIRTMEHFRAKPGRPSNGIMRSSRQITRSPTTMILAPTGQPCEQYAKPNRDWRRNGCDFQLGEQAIQGQTILAAVLQEAKACDAFG